MKEEDYNPPGLGVVEMVGFCDGFIDANSNWLAYKFMPFVKSTINVVWAVRCLC
jgi:hypothetical protein